MIKPSHYDDDGYPIQWLRSAIPSNTLACLFALADDARRRQVLGAAVDLRLHTYDKSPRTQGLKTAASRTFFELTFKPLNLRSGLIQFRLEVNALPIRLLKL